MTFSIIVPVYNVEKYLAKCLDSILSQTYTDYEIIVVNDGSPDNSQAIIDNYCSDHSDKIKAFAKENGGLSDARNFGIEKAQGEYLLFVDSDDYIADNLLKKIKDTIDQTNADMVRFNCAIVYENGVEGELLTAPVMTKVAGEEAINRLIDHKQYFEPACFYAYKRSFWQNNGFSFEVGKYHEDFGLIPNAILKSTNFCAIDYCGYFYVQSSSSICRGVDYQKNVIKANDVLLYSLNHIKNSANLIADTNIKKKFCSYIANAAIEQLNTLKGDEKKQYLRTLKKERIFDLLLQDSLKRALKKTYTKLKYGAF